MADTVKLYEEQLHPHRPRPLRQLIEAEHLTASLNQRLAVTITRSTGTMLTAYLFAGLALIGLLAILGLLSPLVALLVTWTSQTFIQLCMLPILSVGQSVIGKQQELQGEETYLTTQKSYHDVRELVHHLAAQDSELLAQSQKIDRLLALLEASPHV